MVVGATTVDGTRSCREMRKVMPGDNQDEEDVGLKGSETRWRGVVVCVS